MADEDGNAYDQHPIDVATFTAELIQARGAAAAPTTPASVAAARAALLAVFDTGGALTKRVGEITVPGLRAAGLAKAGDVGCDMPVDFYPPHVMTARFTDAETVGVATEIAKWADDIVSFLVGHWHPSRGFCQSVALRQAESTDLRRVVAIALAMAHPADAGLAQVLAEIAALVEASVSTGGGPRQWALDGTWSVETVITLAASHALRPIMMRGIEYVGTLMHTAAIRANPDRMMQCEDLRSMYKEIAGLDLWTMLSVVLCYEPPVGSSFIDVLLKFWDDGYRPARDDAAATFSSSSLPFEDYGTGIVAMLADRSEGEGDLIFREKGGGASAEWRALSLAYILQQKATFDNVFETIPPKALVRKEKLIRDLHACVAPYQATSYSAASAARYVGDGAGGAAYVLGMLLPTCSL